MKISKTGQSLIEVLAALAVVILVILALMAIITTSIRNSTFAKNQSLASRYARESIEGARKLRDGNKEEFFAPDFLPSCNKNETLNDFFQLQRTCDLVEINRMMKINVRVTWEDAKGEHRSELNTYLTKW